MQTRSIWGQFNVLPEDKMMMRGKPSESALVKSDNSVIDSESTASNLLEEDMPQTYGQALELCNNAYARKENHQHDCPQCKATTRENEMCELGRILIHRWLNARMDVQALEPMPNDS